MQRQRQQRPIKRRPPRRTKSEIKAAAQPIKKPSTGKNRLVLAIIAVVLVIAVIAGSAYYMVAVQPFQRVILSVGDDNIKTGYFLRRMVASQGMNAQSVVDSLASEVVIEQQAAALGFPEVTAQEIDDYLRNVAKGDAETISDADFNSWFKEQQDRTGLSASEFKQIAAGQVQAQRLQDAIGANVKTEVPQVHLWIIVQTSQDATLAAKARIDGGETFDVVAREVSTDTNSRDSGGDMGWQVPELLNSQITTTLDTLDIGKCSDPIALTQTDSTTGTTNTSYVLVMVSEKSAYMAVTDTQLSQMQYMAFLDWLNKQKASTEIVFHGLSGSTTLDNKTLSWINYQVQELIRKLPKTTTTTETTIPTTTEPITTEPVIPEPDTSTPAP